VDVDHGQVVYPSLERLPGRKCTCTSSPQAVGGPRAARADTVGGLVPGEHVAEAGDAAVWAASHGQPFERERGPGAVPQQVFQALKVTRYVAGWELPADWRLDAAIRYAYSEGEANWFSRWSPSVVLRVPVTERLEVHAEWFGTFTQGLVDDTHRPTSESAKRR
jgi:hypothetical protein